MSTRSDGLRSHVRDRGTLRVGAVRLALCAGIAYAPFLVGLPSHHQLVSIAYFIPMVFGVLGAIGLREHVQWLRPRNRLLWLCRGAVTALVDLSCLAGLLLTIDGRPERMGILAGALLAATVGMLVACIAQDFAWLGAAGVGFLCLLSFDQAVTLSLPIAAATIAYGLTLVVYSIRGPSTG